MNIIAFCCISRGEVEEDGCPAYGGGRVLRIEGINMSGANAAANYSFSEEAFSVLDQILSSSDQDQLSEVLILDQQRFKRLAARIH
ncbi:hypothetical protein [Granulicella tundricola]|uniref:Uncharacterized protein n=1 Tax=Granulicella tundricola (strain ATCC BAA-1859 / DSM 23138 / MP5ACTX9) TaxID=1198114 RepID=E8X6L4_GRATM|nr:hypothetical protein AciX9_3883 [Granulicella tundricola MP5ACTX9]